MNKYLIPIGLAGAFAGCIGLGSGDAKAGSVDEATQLLASRCAQIRQPDNPDDLEESITYRIALAEACAASCPMPSYLTLRRDKMKNVREIQGNDKVKKFTANLGGFMTTGIDVEIEYMPGVVDPKILREWEVMRFLNGNKYTPTVHEVKHFGGATSRPVLDQNKC